jgi:hypothetical protein
VSFSASVSVSAFATDMPPPKQPQVEPELPARRSEIRRQRQSLPQPNGPVDKLLAFKVCFEKIRVVKLPFEDLFGLLNKSLTCPLQNSLKWNQSCQHGGARSAASVSPYLSP